MLPELGCGASMLTLRDLTGRSRHVNSVERSNLRVIEGGSLSGNGLEGTTVYVHKVRDMRRCGRPMP